MNVFLNNASNNAIRQAENIQVSLLPVPHHHESANSLSANAIEVTLYGIVLPSRNGDGPCTGRVTIAQMGPNE